MRVFLAMMATLDQGSQLILNYANSWRTRWRKLIAGFVSATELINTPTIDIIERVECPKTIYCLIIALSQMYIVAYFTAFVARDVPFQTFSSLLISFSSWPDAELNCSCNWRPKIEHEFVNEKWSRHQFNYAWCKCERRVYKQARATTLGSVLGSDDEGATFR